MKTPFNVRGGQLTAVAILFALCIPTVAYSQKTDAPHSISYQGVLMNAGGTAPIADGSHSAVFIVYTDPAATTQIWRAMFTIATTNGLFNSQLGTSEQPFPSPLNQPLWLGVAIDGGAEMRPLTALLSAPYAMGIVDSSVITPKIVDGNVTTPKLQDSAVTTVKIRNSAVTPAKVASDYVGHVTLNNKSITTVKNGDIDIATGPNITMSTMRDSLTGNLHVVLDGAGGSPSGAIVAFPTAAAYPGFTYTGAAQGVGDFWSARAQMPMPIASGNVVGAAAVNGKVYLFGGTDTAAVATSGVQEFDPSTNRWAARTPLPFARANTAAVALNGKIYVVGGATISSNTFTTIANVDVYDPATDTWSAETPLHNARMWNSAVAVNGKIYAIGGSAATSTYVSSVEALDPLTHVWSLVTTLPTPLVGLSMATVLGNKIYVTGAGTPLYNGVMYAYDPAVNTWTVCNAPPYFPSGGAVCTLNGRLYLMGGRAEVSGYTDPTKSPTMEFDPTLSPLGSWTERALPSGGVWWQAAAVVNGKCYLFSSLLPVQEYTPPTFLYYYKKN